MRALLDEWGLSASIGVHHGDPDAETLARLIADADVVLNGHTRMDAALLGGAKGLRSVVFLGTGASSYIDVEAAEKLDIRVRVVRGYGDRTVAEHAFGLLLAAARDTARMDRNIRTGRWATSEGMELQGRTLGLIGLGGVGSEMARIASAFGMRVIAWNRTGVPGSVPAEAASLDDVLSTSDAISLHLALVPETRGMIGVRELARMKPGVLFVNTARGAIVDETALADALRSGHVAHAALDVFATEPLPRDHPFSALDNVTLTSHAAWKSKASSRRLMRMALDIAEADATCLAAGKALPR
jgi:D-3-phosphoglycerate dehydrogenase